MIHGTSFFLLQSRNTNAIFRLSRSLVFKFIIHAADELKTCSKIVKMSTARHLRVKTCFEELEM